MKHKQRKPKKYGSLAQLGEHLPYKQRVIGSSPIVSTTCGEYSFSAQIGRVVQLVRTPACHAGGRGFEPHSGRYSERTLRIILGESFCFHASVAQSVEQGTENPRVDGSIPSGGIYADLAHLVERHLAKVEVASSSLVIRSTY